MKKVVNTFCVLFHWVSLPFSSSSIFPYHCRWYTWRSSSCCCVCSSLIFSSKWVLTLLGSIESEHSFLAGAWMAHPPVKHSVPNYVFPFSDKRLLMLVETEQKVRGTVSKRQDIDSIFINCVWPSVRQDCQAKAKCRETGAGSHGGPESSLSTCFRSQLRLPNLPARSLHHLWSKCWSNCASQLLVEVELPHHDNHSESSSLTAPHTMKCNPYQPREMACVGTFSWKNGGVGEWAKLWEASLL